LHIWFPGRLQAFHVRLSTNEKCNTTSKLSVACIVPTEKDTAISISNSLEFSMPHQVPSQGPSPTEYVFQRTCSFASVKEDVDSSGLELVSETLPGLLARQARLTPDNIALDTYEGTWTYSQLQHEIVRLSHYLAKQQISSGTFIGIILPLSAKSIMTLVAIMALGSAVVPVDMDHPPARKMAMFREAKVTAVVVEDSKSNPEWLSDNFTVVELAAFSLQDPSSSAALGVTEDDKTLTAVRSQPKDDAYVAFTSGSTGTPKGIVQTHDAIITMSRALAASLDVQTSSRVAQIAPYVFDVAMMEFAMSWGTGAALCTMRREVLIFPKPGEVAENLTAARITHISLSPTMLKTIALGSIPSVRVLSVMGEVLDRTAVQTWSTTPETEFRQMWGCTEGTILQSITPAIEAHREPQNVGFTLPGACRLWIADSQDANKLLADGEVGEIIVESRALASRYINQPEQTAKAFLQDVSWTKRSSSDTRFYRTGDMAKKAPDGSLTFVGRQDGQTSLHGERVELGEIDYHIDRLKWPTNADCLAEYEASAQRIVGFICARPDGSVGSQAHLEILPWEKSILAKEVVAEKMQQLLSDGNLASNMVPSWWFPVPTRPLTISHKTNRLALRALLKELTPEEWEVYRMI
jgi:amino acid adenylation domain-containing protein